MAGGPRRRQRGGEGRADALEAPFVGRDEELRQLKEQLHAVGRDRRARLVSITGPGGIGKSRLVWELEKYIDGVAEDIYWHRGRSPSYGEGITFWALGEMVRRRRGLTEDDDEATTRERVAATLEEFVGGRERARAHRSGAAGPARRGGGSRRRPRRAVPRLAPLLRAHRGAGHDGARLRGPPVGRLRPARLHRHLLDWSQGQPILVVTLARPELFDRRPDWGASRRHLTALALEPLTDDEVRELLDGLVPGLPDDALAAIVARAEGMPLYAVETVRGLLAEAASSGKATCTSRPATCRRSPSRSPCAR